MKRKPEVQTVGDYLAQIAHELRHLPTSARADELREIESHLRAMITARDDNSTVEALVQFGKPRQVGRDLRRAWERKQPETWWQFAEALNFTVTCFFCLMLPWLQGTDGFDKLAIHPGLLAISLMFATSYITALISPKRGCWIVGGLLAFLFWPNLTPEALTVYNWAFGAVNLVFPAMFGFYLGARHSRRLFSRIAQAK